MEIDRRRFLAGASALAVAGVTSSLDAAGAAGPADAVPELFAAARKTAAGRHEAAIFSLTRGDVARVPLPARGHDIAVHPGGRRCVVFARSPGRFAAQFSADARPPISFKAKAGRHFFGHGAFSSDGRLLLTTENDFGQGRGVIGVRDATDGYRQIGEFSSHGVGPHDMALLSDGRTLVIANGGLETHPDFGRKILNLPDMRPSLVYVDSTTGDILEEHVLRADLHKLSIRHLAVAADDTVIFGCQYKGPAADRPKLIGSHRRGAALRLSAAPAAIHHAMSNHVGSIAVDRSGTIAAASSPRGGLITFWDVSTMRYLGETRLTDGCGLASTAFAKDFLVTSGAGQLMRAGPAASQIVRPNAATPAEIKWDNHAAALADSNTI